MRSVLMTIYVYPLGFAHRGRREHVYGYTDSSSCCPINFAQGTYVRPVTNSVLDPIDVPGQEKPTLFGSRVIAHAGTTSTSRPRRPARTGPASRRGSTSRPPGSTFAAPTSRRADSWPRSSSSSGPAARGRSGRSPWCRPKAPISRPLAPSSASCPRAVSPRSPRCGLNPDDQRGSMRAALAAGADLADRLAGRYRRRGRGRIPARSAGRGRAVCRRCTADHERSDDRRHRAAGDRPEEGHHEGTGQRQRGRPVVAATGSATAKRAGKVTVRLRLTSAARNKRTRLIGARMTLRVSQRHQARDASMTAAQVAVTA